ncbi:type 1 glutamine amidotransferase domain-containing protein [Paraburkholderia hospita]|uniref:type 1 glutamine amidotransferase domain-containing protein n=1 Tax=Paraburkholderia hospita TaxID=169430 RepID=UPI000B34496B|nr:type 1 glutamine amidotransferase domain-containing protein [Paraburkholderia hospita]OUL77802.1 type 1 glutamine amidotransferase domain-containing protein [Paraburkholderia hospita]
MNIKGKILVVGSSGDTFELKDSQKEPMGYYLNELAIPAQAAVDAGYEITLATPAGGQPQVDQHSLVADHFGGSQQALQQALDFVATNSGMQNPRSIRAVIEEGLENYVGVFVPGGHPPMVDLMQDPDLGEVLRHFHMRSKPTALLCHGPIAVTAAMPDAAAFRQALVEGDLEAAKAAAKGWQYAGYRMTVFSNDEEKYVEENIMGGSKVPFYVATALEIAGGNVETKGVFVANAVQDRELITGQNPPSDHAVAELFVKALDRHLVEKATL